MLAGDRGYAAIRHSVAKLQAETPLTPARSFRDEDLLVELRDSNP
jgi:hypothetical protein